MVAANAMTAAAATTAAAAADVGGVLRGVLSRQGLITVKISRSFVFYFNNLISNRSSTPAGDLKSFLFYFQ